MPGSHLAVPGRPLPALVLARVPAPGLPGQPDAQMDSLVDSLLACLHGIGLKPWQMQKTIDALIMWNTSSLPSATSNQHVCRQGLTGPMQGCLHSS